MKELYLLTPCLVQVSDEDFMCLCGLTFNLDEGGYLRCRTPPYRGKRIHQIVAMRMGLVLKKGEEVDHKDTNKFNNQRNNLRAATRREQEFNKGLREHNSSGTTGVRYHDQSGLWMAYWIEPSGQVTKYRKTEAEAVELRERKAKEFYGEFFNPG